MNALLKVVLVFTMFSQTACAPSAFFPRGALSDFAAEAYSKSLARMEEPSLVGAPAGAKIYRFTLLPAFDNDVTVRLTLSNNGGSAIDAKRLDGPSGFDSSGFVTGKLVEKASTTLTAAQVKEFQELFGKVGLPKMTAKDSVLGLDGSTWILEAVENGKYHIAVRWSPASYNTAERGLSEFVELCEWLYRASPLKGDAKNGRHGVNAKGPMPTEAGPAGDADRDGPEVGDQVPE